MWNIVVAAVAFAALVATSIALLYLIESVEQRIIVKAAEKISEKDMKNYDGKFCVYVLTDGEKKKSSYLDIFYVGRTQHLGKRYSHHKNRKKECEIHVVYECGSLVESRLVEQVVLATCLVMNLPLFTFGEGISNLINGIAQRKVEEVVKKIDGRIDTVQSLLGCTADSDWLTLCGY